MSNKPIISVAMCTCEGEKYIIEQLESILNQSLSVDEIVICDDCSTDRTVQFVTNISKKNPNVRFKIKLNKTRLGVRMNFEQSLNMCTGDIIFLSDQDDIWYPTKVEKIINYFNANKNISVVFTNANLINSDNKPYSNYTLFDCVGLDNNGLHLCDNGYFLNIFLTNGRAYGSTMAIRNNVSCNFDYPTELYHDYILSIEAIINNSLGYIKEPLMHYRIHDGQTSGIGPAEIQPPKINIFDIGHINFNGYPCPLIIKEELNIRDLRFSFYKSGLPGILRILINYRKYKKHYKNEWTEYMIADIERIKVKFKSNHSIIRQCSPS